MQKSFKLAGHPVVMAAVASISFSAAAQAGFLTSGPTGTLDTSYYGSTPISVQTNATTSPTDGGGSGGPSDEVTASSTGDFTQLANVYAKIDTTGASPFLNMFIGGSLNAGDQGVSHYIVALQLQSTGGVSSLAGQHIHGSVYEGNGNDPANENSGNDGLQNVGFDSGFTPTVLLVLDPSTGAYTGLTDLTGGGATSTFTQAYNGALEHTPIGTGASGDPGFAGATTGEEFSLSLASLGYTSGDIKAMIFTTNGGQDGRTNNQVLSPFTYVGSGPDGQVSPYDYTYIDNHEGPDAGRQFNGEAYPGNQYFTIAGAAVPEPASMSLLALAGAGLLGRRSRKA